MKVLHMIAGGDSGGAKTHVLSLLGELNQTEDVTLLCLGAGVLAEEARAMGLPVQVAEGGFAAGLAAARTLGAQAEILHCHGSRANLTGALVKGRVPCPVVTTVHSDPRLDYLGRKAAGAVFGTLNRWALDRMDALVCVSEAMKETCRRRGYTAGRLYHIYNGPDFSRPLRAVDRQRWLEELGCPVSASDVVIGVLARLDPVKDLPTMLRGFARAAAEAPELKLLIAGSGREEARLKGLIVELGLEGKAFLPGWVEDTESFFAAVDAVALSSLYETFPYALTGGGRYGKPAVAAAVGGVPALIDHGENGYLFPPGDENALGEVLLALRDGETRRRLGAALEKKTREQFSLQAMAARQREIYRRILAGEVE